MKVNGRTESNTEWEYTHQPVASLKRENGVKASV